MSKNALGEMHWQTKNPLHIRLKECCRRKAHTKKVLRVTKLLNTVDGIKETIHYRHGRKELGTQGHLGGA